MRGAILLACTLLALSGCKGKSTPPPGGGNNNGGGGPTAPDPIATTGAIGGTVTLSGVGVSDARVMLGLGSLTTTGASGEYRFADVTPGTHNVTLFTPGRFALAPGETSLKTATVVAGQTSTISWTLVPPTLGPSTWIVELAPTRFVPSDVSIRRGDEVSWVNAQPVFHTISPDDRNQPGAWRTQNMPARTGASFSHVFNTDGTFHYSCTVHIGMTGVVRVR